MTNIQLVKETNREELESLYLTAFPIEERKPFHFLLEREKENKSELYSIMKDEKFCGLAILFFHEDLVLLNYFAIKKEFRGQNLGSLALELILEKVKEKTLVLEIESTKVDAADLKIRKAREQFYLKNGLYHLDISVKLAGVELMLMGNKPSLSYEKYFNLYYNAVSSEFATKQIQKL